MSAEQVRAPQPICEACWIESHSQWEPESMDDDGNILMRLKDVDVPIKFNVGTVEICSECGKVTIAGIYDIPPTKRIGFSGVDTLYETETGDDDEG